MSLNEAYTDSFDLGKAKYKLPAIVSGIEYMARADPELYRRAMRAAQKKFGDRMFTDLALEWTNRFMQAGGYCDKAPM